MIKNVIFDFDGVIADGLSIVADAINILAKKYSSATTDSRTLRRIGQGKWIKRHIPKNQIASLLVEGRQLISAKIPNAPMVSGIKEVLGSLYGDYSLGILSSNSKENIIKFLRQNSLETTFEYIEIDDTFTNKEEALLRLLRKRGFTTSDSVYIADETRDILACRQINLPLISVTWGYESEETLSKSKPQLLARTPKDILRCLGQIK